MLLFLLYQSLKENIQVRMKRKSKVFFKDSHFLSPPKKPALKPVLKLLHFFSICPKLGRCLRLCCLTVLWVIETFSLQIFGDWLITEGSSEGFSRGMLYGVHHYTASVPGHMGCGWSPCHEKTNS